MLQEMSTRLQLEDLTKQMEQGNRRTATKMRGSNQDSKTVHLAASLGPNLQDQKQARSQDEERPKLQDDKSEQGCK